MMMILLDYWEWWDRYLLTWQAVGVVAQYVLSLCVGEYLMSFFGAKFETCLKYICQWVCIKINIPQLEDIIYI